MINGILRALDARARAFRPDHRRSVFNGTVTEGSDYDIAIVGGGIVGCGIARDAALPRPPR